MAKTPEEALNGLAEEQSPVLEEVLRMNLDTLEHSSLDPRSYWLARLAALVAVDAPPASYVVNLAAAADAGITAEDVQGLLVAIAPITGTPRVTAAAGNLLRGLGMVEAVADAGIRAHVLWANRDSILPRADGRRFAERLGATFTVAVAPDGRAVDHDWMFEDPDLFVAHLRKLGIAALEPDGDR